MISKKMWFFILNTTFNSLIIYFIALSISVIFCLKKSIITFLISINLNGTGEIFRLISNNLNGIWYKFLVVFMIFFIAHYRISIKNKDVIFNKNSNVYLKWSYWFLCCFCWLFGFNKVNLINIPVWLQFKICMSNYLDGYVYDIKKSNYKFKYRLIRKNNNNEINIILNDTYFISDDQISEKVVNFDTYVIEKESHGQDKKMYSGIRSFNGNLIENFTEIMYKVYKNNKYNTVNLFLSTNPKNIKCIVNECFKLDIREKKLKINVFQDNGERHIYNEIHKIM